MRTVGKAPTGTASVAAAGELNRDLVTFAELEQAFEHVPVGLAIMGGDGRILRVNRAMAALIGYEPNELVGKTVVDVTHPDDLSDSLDNRERLRRGDIDHFSLDKRYVRKDGGVSWARVYVSRLAEPGNQHYWLHAVDITKEKIAEQTVEATEERFREMTEAIDQDFWMMSIEPLQLLYTSPAAARIWGFDPMRNRDHPGDISQWVHPEDVGIFGELFGSMLAGATEREYRIVRPDGTVRWLRSRVFPVHDANGTVYRVAGVTEDVTARKQAEDELERHRGFERIVTKLSTEFVNLPSDRVQERFPAALGELCAMIGADRGAIFVIDDEDRVASLKHQWSAPGVAEVPVVFRHLDFAPGHPLREALLRDFLLRVDSVADLPPAMAAQRAQLIENRIGSFIDVPLLVDERLVGFLAFGTHDRTTTWPADVGALLRIAAELFCNAIARRRAEDAMRVHRDSLAHVLRLGTLGKLASGLAHELNQPLSAILSYVRGCERLLANGDVGRPEFHTGLRKIAEQAVRAADVIKTLRAIVRKSEGRRDWHEFNGLVDAALRFIEPEIADSGITITAHLAPDLPQVQVDAIQIEQVIVNLLRNALDALEAASDGAAQEIRVSTKLGGANDIEITVADNGGGIDPREAERVFDEFFTTKTEGLGLGLSISRSIVEAHGGRIWLVENSPDGATFRFTIPAMAPLS